MKINLNKKKDVFISFKKTSIGNRDSDTPDVAIAHQLYKLLQEENIPTFFSERSIYDEGISDYATEINKSLEDAKVMIVIATDIEHIFQPGVEYEWKKFKEYMDAPLEEQSFERKLFTLLKDVDLQMLEERGFPKTESDEFSQNKEINYDLVVGRLRNALQDSYHVELKQISQNSYYNFIRLNKLDEDYDPDLFGSITPLNKEFHDFTTAYSNLTEPIRAQITGDDESGRKTQVLDFWKKNLDKKLGDRDIILHVPLYHSFFSENKDLYEFLYRTYFTQLTGQNYIALEDSFEEFYKSLSDAIQKEGYRFLLIFDGIENLKEKKETGMDIETLLQIIHPTQEALKETGLILISLKKNRTGRRFTEYHIEPLSEDQIVDYLFKNKIKGRLSYQSKKNLKIPKSLKRYVEGYRDKNKQLHISASLIDEIIDSAVESMDEQGLKTLDERDRFYYSLKLFLPIFAALHADNYFEKSTLGTKIKDTTDFIINNNVESAELDYLSNDLLFDFYKTSDFLNQIFIPNYIEIMDFFSQDENNIYWKNEFIRDYFRAKGTIILSQQKSLQENIALKNLQDELIELRTVLIRPNKDLKTFDHDVLTQVQNVYELFDDVGSFDTRFIANIAIVLDSYGDEETKYDYAVKALQKLINLETEELSANELASYLSTVAYIKNKARVAVKEKSPNEDIARQALYRALRLVESDLEGKIIETKIHGNLGSFWQNWAAYAKNHSDPREDQYRLRALKEHKHALSMRNKLKEKLPEDHEKRREIDYGLRRSYASIATDYFHLKDYLKSAEFNDMAIEIGEAIQDPERYENYSRKAGALIFLNNQEESWNIEKIVQILHLLKNDYEIMEYYRTIQTNEVEDIYKKLDIIISKSNDLKMSRQEYKLLKDTTDLIEEAYEKSLNKRTNALRKKVLDIDLKL